jgi:hypothetical protein
MTNIFATSARVVDLGIEDSTNTDIPSEVIHEELSDVYTDGVPVSRIKPGTIVKLDNGDTAVIGDDYGSGNSIKKRIAYVGNTRNVGTDLLLPNKIVHIVKHFSIEQ